jgi:hypothetical protein
MSGQSIRNHFLRWLIGSPPETVGLYWGEYGTCAVYQPAMGQQYVVYEPAMPISELPIWEAAVSRLELMSGLSRRQMCLSVALDANDVFQRTMTVPNGLSDEQLDQVAIVEAVANLPVPPEEICLDSLRDKTANAPNEIVNLAFCRRETMDAILAAAEEVGVPAWIVDRDVQAIHDALQADCTVRGVELRYPFAILLTELHPRLLICLSALSIEVYPIGLHQTSLGAEIANCWTRCSLSRPVNLERLGQIVIVGDAPEVDTPGFKDLMDQTGAKIILPPDWQSENAPFSEPMPPSEILLVAQGMSRRNLL